MVTEQVGLWSHDHLAGMFLGVVEDGAELGVILWEGRGKEGQERPPWVHVKVDLSGKGQKRGHWHSWKSEDVRGWRDPL
jgi:hypothetical protein